MALYAQRGKPVDQTIRKASQSICKIVLVAMICHMHFVCDIERKTAKMVQNPFFDSSGACNKLFSIPWKSGKPVDTRGAASTPQQSHIDYQGKLHTEAIAIVPGTDT